MPLTLDERATRRLTWQRLFDAYGPLLTAPQREAIRLHLEEDWSMSELAAARRVSRAAAHDLVRRGLGHLQTTEARLGLALRLARLEAERDRLRRRVRRLQSQPSASAPPPPRRAAGV
ncbi:MAG TPA: DNA-binding protein [Candidatus Micrarchaeia archaeon]|nr:DNA-binding protein [Candidatus Micrarchaeia archaeon]